MPKVLFATLICIICIMHYSKSVGCFDLNLNPTRSERFVLNLIDQQLNRCSLLIFQDGFKHQFRLESVLANIKSLTYYNIQFPLLLESETIQTTHGLTLQKGRNVTQRSLSFRSRFPINISNFKKKSHQCTVSILLVNDLRAAFMKQIFIILTPVFIPVTRKDTDYYIFVTESKNIDKLLLMDELPARIKYKIGVGEDDIRDLPIVVKTVCFFCNGGKPQILQYPHEFTEGFEYFPDFVQNLNGKVLRISSPLIRTMIEFYPPFTTEKDCLNNARRGAWKSLFDESLMIKFNFSYRMLASTGTGKDGKIGAGGSGLQLPNGTWIGVVGDLISGRADLGIVTAHTATRILHIDFTDAFFDDSFLSFVTSEGPQVYSPAALLWPFDLWMWLCLFLSTLVAFAVFAFIKQATLWLNLERFATLNFAHRGVTSQKSWNVNYQIQFILTSLLEQDCVMPTFSPMRTFAGMWLFCVLVLTTAYRSKLVTLLAFPVIEPLPSRFDELVYTDYKIGFTKQGDAAYNTLASSNDPVYVKLVKEMEIITGGGLECLEKVLTEKYACIGYDASLRYAIARNFSDREARKLVFAPSHTFNVFLGLATEGHSIYKSNFGRTISTSRAFHLQDLWHANDLNYDIKVPKQTWWLGTNQTDKLTKNDQAYEQKAHLTLKHILGAFYALTAFLGLSTIAFIVECIPFYVLKGLLVKYAKKKC